MFGAFFNSLGIALRASASLAAARRAGRKSVFDPIPFPSQASSDDEKLSRLKAKAEALADKPEFEVKFFLAKHAADVGVSPEQVEARNARRRESKEKGRASLFRRLKGLPDARRRTEIEQWCRQWSEGTEV